MDKHELDHFVAGFNSVEARHKLPSLCASPGQNETGHTSRLLRLSLDAAQMADRVVLTELDKRNGPGERFYRIWPGEHYRLLYALIKVMDAKNIIEIGTDSGMSAVAMASALPHGGVVNTFDIKPWRDFESSWLCDNDFESGQIVQHIVNLQDWDNYIKFSKIFSEADLIFIDGPKDVYFEAALLGHMGNTNIKKAQLSFSTTLNFRS